MNKFKLLAYEGVYRIREKSERKYYVRSTPRSTYGLVHIAYSTCKLLSALFYSGQTVTHQSAEGPRMHSSIFWIICITLQLSVSACVHKTSVRVAAQENWVNTLRSEGLLNYTPISAQSKIGHIISVDESNGTVFSQSRREDCMSSLRAPEWYQASFLETTELTLASLNTTSELAETYKDKIDFTLLTESDSIKYVAVDFTQPTIAEYTVIEIEKAIQKIKEDDLCFSKIQNTNNYLIFREVQAEGLSYTFLDGSKKKIDADSTIIDAVTVSADVNNLTIGNGNLEMDFKGSIGYQVLQLVSITAGNPVTMIISPNDLEKRLGRLDREF